MEYAYTEKSLSDAKQLAQDLKAACKKIAPLWPLENFVAVNPYLGLIDEPFNEVAHKLSSLEGIQMTLPSSFYLQKIQEGEINSEDLQSALSRNSYSEIDPEKLLSEIVKQPQEHIAKVPLQSLVDTASDFSHKDWKQVFIARITSWAASYFDKGQASWIAADQSESLFLAWKQEAEIDPTPEIMGIPGFRKAAKALPADPLQAAEYALSILKISGQQLPGYLHLLLLKTGGWSSYMAQLDWEIELHGNEGNQLPEFLTILMSWEACLYQCLKCPELDLKWEEVKRRNLTISEQKLSDTDPLAYQLILQEALNKSAQRKLIDKFKKVRNSGKSQAKKLLAQAIFCIDVRSEVFRRNLESVDKGIETIGFAGFFGFPVNYIPIAGETGEAQCPVLIPPSVTVLETTTDKVLSDAAEKSRRLSEQTSELWKRLKSGAVTCFGFVSPLGFSYLFKLFSDSFQITRPVPDYNKAGLKSKFLKSKTVQLQESLHHQMTAGIPMEQRVLLAKNALEGMSLTQNFGQFVLFVGHGSSSVNNPHASGLDCGACGGHSGEANARVAAAVLNDAQVRLQLKSEHIQIPDDTFFLACLHDTTTDEVEFLNKNEVPQNLISKLSELEESFRLAGNLSRMERTKRMSVPESKADVLKLRSKDWSQVRPEWGLAGCNSFIIASRERTRRIDLGGQSFLHSYDWERDSDFSVLEGIMTAPMVVTSWINLQYYASTVDNTNHGAGNKTLHNVTAGLGVLEGYTGDLRVGLPIQSVHDGEKFQHEPVKLNVVIEAPLEAINRIINKHKSIKDLIENEWINLLAIDQEGIISHRYAGKLHWEEV